MIAEFPPSVIILARQAKADEASVAAAKEKFPAMPAEYFELVNESTELELQVGRIRYVRIWGPLGCIEMDEAYHISDGMERAIPIGDDGGGEVIFYANGPKGFGLYHVGFGNLDVRDSEFIAPSLRAFLCEGIGTDSL
jgi:hypothetical protein